MTEVIILFFMLGVLVAVISLRAKYQIETVNRQKYWQEAKPLLQRKLMIEYHAKQVTEKEEAIALLNELVEIEGILSNLKERYNVKL